ncbi:UNVERIFIED_CONTAM: hypothetical protein FKN15_055667 [Acipenser sinensis]
MGSHHCRSCVETNPNCSIQEVPVLPGLTVRQPWLLGAQGHQHYQGPKVGADSRVVFRTLLLPSGQGTLSGELCNDPAVCTNSKDLFAVRTQGEC